jgi:hypothetical protein
MLGEQLHIGLALDLSQTVAPVTNAHFVKPGGGLWTSSFIDGRSEWVDWVESERFLDSYSLTWHVLTPDPASRIYVIDSLADLTRLLDRYAVKKKWDGSMRWPDFERIAGEYDAMHLTAEGQWATRLTHPDSLYGWDCESTLWFRWSFTKCVTVEAKRQANSASPVRFAFLW